MKGASNRMEVQFDTQKHNLIRTPERPIGGSIRRGERRSKLVSHGSELDNKDWTFDHPGGCRVTVSSHSECKHSVVVYPCRIIAKYVIPALAPTKWAAIFQSLVIDKFLEFNMGDL